MSPLLQEMFQDITHWGNQNWTGDLFISALLQGTKLFSPTCKIWCTCLFIKEAKQNVSFTSMMKRAFKLRQLSLGPSFAAYKLLVLNSILDFLFFLSPTSGLYSPASNIVHCGLWMSSKIVTCAIPSLVHQNIPRPTGGWRPKSKGTQDSYMKKNFICFIPPTPTNMHGTGYRQATDILGCLLHFLADTDKYTVSQWWSYSISLNSVSSSINWE